MDAAQATPRILFVDDDPEIRAIYRRLARMAGLHGEVAANGVEAIGLARHRLYAVVVTDWTMPSGGGEKLIDQLFRAQPNAVPLVVTGVRPPPVVTDAGGAPVEVISKPWSPHELLDAIRRAAARASRPRTMAASHRSADRSR